MTCLAYIPPTTYYIDIYIEVFSATMHVLNIKKTTERLVL